jgi:hypothetical protein
MGYFDALTSSSFKTTLDGHRLFFPWGVLGRGYVIGSEPEYKRLRGHVKIYLIIGIAGAIPAGLAAAKGVLTTRDYLAGFVVAAAWGLLCIVFYIAWLRYLLRGLQPSDEKLSLRESMATQAREQSLMLLWVAEIGSIGFVAASIFIFVFDPGKWLAATGGILFFSFCAVCIAFMLFMRRRT